MKHDEFEAWQARDYTTLEDLAKVSGHCRQTVAERVSVFPKTKPGTDGARLYPREAAWGAVCDGTNEGKSPQLLTTEIVLRIQIDLLQLRYSELQTHLAPITTVRRMRKEVTDYVREVSVESFELGRALYARMTEQEKRKFKY